MRATRCRVACHYAAAIFFMPYVAAAARVLLRQHFSQLRLLMRDMLAYAAAIQ